MWESIEKAVEGCFDYTGRATRSEFWYFVTITTLITCAMSAFNKYSGIGAFILFLAPTLSLTTRRLHDTNRRGWWQLLMAVPAIGPAILFFWLSQKSKPANPPKK